MLMGFRKSNWKWIAGSLFLAAAMGIPVVSRAQSPGDVIRIGSPSDWSQYESYWNQLINLSAASKPPSAAAGSAGGGGSDATAAATDPKVLEQALIKNLRVSNVRLVPIFKLSGSSQVSGRITNGNSKAVTVSSVNLEVLDPSGNLVQTSAAMPEPSTIPAGATVTFQQRLDTVPPDSGYQVRLSRSNPFTIQGGV
jgi:hypothetical protein